MKYGRPLHFFESVRQPQIFSTGRQPQHYCKWKTPTIFVQMEDDLNILVNESQPLKKTYAN